MNPPIEGSKLRPYGEDYMAPAYLGLVHFVASQIGAIADFEQRTGHDLKSVIKARGMDELIDKASGRQAAVIAAWADYVTEFHWGIEGQEPIGEEL